MPPTESFDLRCQGSGRPDIVLGVLAPLGGLEAGANIAAQTFQTLVAFPQQAKGLTNHLTGCLVQARIDFRVDKLLQFRGQRNVHGGLHAEDSASVRI